MVPAMIVLLSTLPVLAKGTSIAIAVPTALVGALRNRARRGVDLPAAAAGGLAGVSSAVVGSVVGGLVSDSIEATASDVASTVLLVVVVVVVVVASLEVRSLVAERHADAGAPDRSDHGRPLPRSA